MAKKRKAESIVPEDTASYGSFCRAANAIAQLYTSGLNQQKLSYAAGQRDGLEKVLSFVLREHGMDSEISTAYLVAQLRRELQQLSAVQREAGGPAAAGGGGNAGGGGGMAAQGTTTQLDSRVIAHNTGRLLRGEKGAFFAGALSSPARRALPHVANLGAPHSVTPQQFVERAPDAVGDDTAMGGASMRPPRAAGAAAGGMHSSPPEDIAFLSMDQRNAGEEEDDGRGGTGGHGGRAATFRSGSAEAEHDDGEDDEIEEAE